jgi:hypothetical protein
VCVVCVCVCACSIAVLRSSIVPSQYSSTILALFRVPLNLFVVCVLMNLQSLGAMAVSVVCSSLPPLLTQSAPAVMS